LRLIVQEGRASERLATLEVGGSVLEGHPVEIDPTCRSFEIFWHKYVAFLVTNESFAIDDESDAMFEGRTVRMYSKSRFLHHVKNSSQASDEYPGPLLHFRIICEHHLVDVVATETPVVRRIAPPEKIH